MGRIFREIWKDTRTCQSEDFVCTECQEPIYPGDVYSRIVYDYTTERGDSVLEVHKEHQIPCCNPFGANRW